MVGKKWVELSLPVRDETAEAVSNFLFEQGSCGCFEYEHRLHAYFDSETWHAGVTERLESYVRDLQKMGMAAADPDIQVTEVPDTDWNAVWKQNLETIHITHDLIIKPTWVQFSADPSVTVIELDPQMAFGSGVHATTQLVLRAMRPYLNHGISLLDVGTGSGILAIAAARLCHCSIVACDIDPVATETAQQNARLNQVHRAIQFFTGTPDALGEIRMDMLLANINRRTLETMIPVIVPLLKNNGVMILSGVLTEEIEQMNRALRSFPLKQLHHAVQDEWSALVLKKAECV